LLDVLWGTPVNLTEEFHKQTVIRNTFLELLNWDMYPLQTKPTCDGDLVTFNVREKDLHPDGPLMLNGTTFHFRLSFSNPRRPPLFHENFWTLRHNQSGQITSAAAAPSWTIISILRYMKIELRNEVLQQEDPAELHFEFVTVNLADKLVITGISPEGFNFDNAFVKDMSGERRLEDTEATGRELLWQGFTTGIEVIHASGPRITLRVGLGRVEYVRFRLGGVLLPWLGGQALFTFFTTMRGFPQDEMRDCCYPGLPADNPGVVFEVPYRLTEVTGSLLNDYQDRPRLFPFESLWATRFDELCKVIFTFQVPIPHRRPRGGNSLLLLVLRAPPGYEFRQTDLAVWDSSTCVQESDSGACGLKPLEITMLHHWERRVEILLLGLEAFVPLIDYRVQLPVMTPLSRANRVDGAQWVIELTDRAAVDAGQVSRTLGAPSDFFLVNQANFSCLAERRPPEVVVVVNLTFRDVGEVAPNRVEVYAPDGYTFLPQCLRPGQDHIGDTFVSCRERRSLFGANYLSGAIMMTVDNGVPPENLPLTVQMLVKTAAATPEINTWFVRGHGRTGTVSWGNSVNPFRISPMDVTLSYAAIGGTEVTLFLTMVIRYALPWGGHVHIAGPKLYQINCPVTKVLSGPPAPDCSSEDPYLAGCWGLPGPEEEAVEDMPMCDPLHELLLTFRKHTNTSDEKRLQYQQNDFAMAPASKIFMTLNIRVPLNTPMPRSENVFRIRVLDENKIAIDGKLNKYGLSIRNWPIVHDFKLWWSTSVPDVDISVALEFTFNSTVPDGMVMSQEDRVQVFEVVMPEGFSVAARRPTDIKPLNSASSSMMSNWSWSPLVMPRHLWFFLSDEAIALNYVGVFHFSFPVLTPSVENLPLNNIWQVKFCNDAPYCVKQMLGVPVVGFNFGEKTTVKLSGEAITKMTGSFGWRTAPTCCWWLLVPIPLLHLGCLAGC